MMTYDDLLILITTKANQFSLDPNLVKAIVQTESNFNTNAVRYEPNWTYLYRIEWTANYLHITPDTEKMLQKMSWGLMQVMGSVAREFNFSEPLPTLCVPQLGLEYGCIKLKSLFDRYKDESAVISAYNAGTPRKDARGAFINQTYVTTVRANKNKFTARV